MPPPVSTEQVLNDLADLARADFRAGLVKFGINPETALGIRVPVLRQYARQYRRQHPLALALWETGVHEARLLAVFTADPRQVNPELMEHWTRDFNSWDLCDQACGGLFIKTPFAWAKAREWSGRAAEFEKRAGFTLMASLAVHDKKAPDNRFRELFPFIQAGATDERNFVKKAVNWALRQIGKRNLALNLATRDLAGELRQLESKSARWIAADALRELESPAVQARLAQKPAGGAGRAA